MNVSIWWTIPALTGLIGLVIFLGGVGRLFKLRMASGLSRFLFGGVFLAGAMVTALFGMNLQTYARLTHERIAAQVTLEELGPRLYRASVVVPNDKGVMGEPRYYELTGDAMEADLSASAPNGRGSQDPLCVSFVHPTDGIGLHRTESTGPY